MRCALDQRAPSIRRMSDEQRSVPLGRLIHREISVQQAGDVSVSKEHRVVLEASLKPEATLIKQTNHLLEASVKPEAHLEHVFVRVGPARVLAAANPTEVSIERRIVSGVPDVRLGKNVRDMGTVGFGLMLGGAFGHLPGALIGGAVFGLWGQWREDARIVVELWRRPPGD